MEVRIEEDLAGVGLTGVERGRLFETIFPGQAEQLNLAALVLYRPSMLSLDEPTKHLAEPGLGYL